MPSRKRKLERDRERLANYTPKSCRDTPVVDIHSSVDSDQEGPFPCKSRRVFEYTVSSEDYQTRSECSVTDDESLGRSVTTRIVLFRQESVVAELVNESEEQLGEPLAASSPARETPDESSETSLLQINVQEADITGLFDVAEPSSE